MKPWTPFHWAALVTMTLGALMLIYGGGADGLLTCAGGFVIWSFAATSADWRRWDLRAKQARRGLVRR